MNLGDWFLLVIRWLHAIAAVAWVGGGLFYLLVLRSAWRRSEQAPALGKAMGEEFRGLVDIAILVLIVTGAVLSAARLTAGTVGIPYIALLSAKVILALYTFWVVRYLRQPILTRNPERPSGARGMARLLTQPGTVVVLGLVIVLLADTLRLLVEKALTG